MRILETKDLKKYYGKGAGLVKALDGVNLTVELDGWRVDSRYIDLVKIIPYPAVLRRRCFRLIKKEMKMCR